IRNLDFASPFDNTCTAPGFFGCDEYGNVAIESPPGTTALIDFVDPYTVSGQLLIDVDAAPGTFQVLSGPPAGTQVVSPLGGDLDIAARTPMALTDMTNAALADPFESHLYEVTAAANSVTKFSVSSDGSAIVVLLPE